MNSADYNIWDERFSSPDYIYGKEPNAYLREKLTGLKPGRILMPGEGEGRNAVFAALQSWVPLCFDQSTEGRKKALLLASESGVCLDYRISTYQSFYTELKFDAAGLFYTHMKSEIRRIFHRKLSEMLLPGAYIILEAFNKNQLHYPSGGPKDPDMLFTADELREDFLGYEFVELEECITELREGSWHSGSAAVVRMFARKLQD